MLNTKDGIADCRILLLLATFDDVCDEKSFMHFETPHLHMYIHKFL
jgi:hypothetical protein